MAKTSKPAELRIIKSVSFADPGLLDYAHKKAANLFGGNFSAYVMALVERDQAQSQARQPEQDLEARVFHLLRPHGVVDGNLNRPFDIEVPSLRLAVEVRARFPRDKALEYNLVGTLHRASSDMPGYRVALVFPDELLSQEKERFHQLEGAGIERLKVCDFSEFGKFVQTLVDDLPNQSQGDGQNQPVNSGKRSREPQFRDKKRSRLPPKPARD